MELTDLETNHRYHKSWEDQIYWMRLGMCISKSFKMIIHIPIKKW